MQPTFLIKVLPKICNKKTATSENWMRSFSLSWDKNKKCVWTFPFFWLKKIKIEILNMHLYQQKMSWRFICIIIEIKQSICKSINLNMVWLKMKKISQNLVLVVEVMLYYNFHLRWWCNKNIISVPIPMKKRHRQLLLAKRRKNNITEGTVSLHSSFELIEGDFSVTVSIHHVKYLIQFSRFCNINRKTILGQSLFHRTFCHTWTCKSTRNKRLI